MAASNVFQWTVKCTDEDQTFTCYSPTVPLKCPNNIAHTIDMSLTAIVPSSTNVPVSVQIEDPRHKTLGRYQSKTIKMEIKGSNDVKVTGVVSSIDYAFPFPITLMCSQFHCMPYNIGDEVSCAVDRHHTISDLKLDCKIGDSIINVSPSTISNALIGLTASYFNGDETDETKQYNSLGLIVEVDEKKGNITLQYPLTSALVAGSNKLIQVTRYMVHDYSLSNAGIHNLGYSKLGGSYIPAGVTGTIYYTNNGYNDKTFSLMLEYYY
jgi:hypothetical protein